MDLIPSWLIEALLTLRGLIFIGKKYTCPCCGWKLRAFLHGGLSLKKRHLSYCPRCHSKARHRRIWLYLIQKTNLFSEHLYLLHVSPQYSLSRRFMSMPNIIYFGIDLRSLRNICAKMDLTNIPVRSDTFNAIICIHVLEEIKDDRQAMRELFRVLKPGGWVLISVPTRLDQKTFEDPTITAPKDRKRAFGETAHVRIYGYDLVERLKKCGFRVKLDLAKDIERQAREKYGLRDDENIFYCTKD